MPALWPLGSASASTISSRIQWLVVASIVPVAVLAVANVVLSYQQARDASLKTNLQAARAIARAVDSELAANVQLLRGLATSRAIDDGNLRRFHDQAREVAQQAAADIVSWQDTELRSLASSARWGPPFPRIAPERDRTPQVLRDGETVVSDLFIGEFSRRPQIALALPVLRDGRPVARLQMLFGVERFDDLLARQGIAPHWTVSLLDGKGAVVARNRDAPAFVGKPASPGFWQRVQASDEGTLDSVTLDGVAVSTAFAHSPEYNWTIVVSMPRDELYARLWRPLAIYGAAAALLLAAGLAMARALGRGIAAPIQALVEPALAIGRGETAPVARSSLREANDLGRALEQAQVLLREREQARRQAEASMQASQSRLQIALEAAEIGDWDIDLASGVERHSLQHDRCFGHPEPIADWSTERFLSLVHPDDRARVTAGVQRALNERVPWQGDFRVVWPDASVHWLTSRCVFAGAAPGFIVGVVIDITSRKQAEELRLRSIELEAQNREIREANRLKSEFLANMSHELRTPLNAVIGFAEILRGSAGALPEAKRDEYLNHIAASGRHLLHLINEVLDLSKIESGKFTLAPEPVDLARLVRDVADVLRSQAARKGVALQAAVDPALGEVVLDPGRVKQMLFNLLDNAIKFTAGGGKVELRVRPEGLLHLRIEVEDSGIGVATADLPKLFRKFQQVHTGPAKAYGGTGLGLALTRHLAELHGGSVGVRSTPGVGSVFHIVLPRRLPDAPPSPLESAPQAAAGAPRVLVIEDDAADQAQITGILHRAGFGADVAANAEIALRLASERRYDAITLDLLLPDRSGLEVLDALRNGGLNSDVPVVVITVVTDTSALAGFAVADVLTKPIRAPDLDAALHGLRSADRAPAVLVVDDDPAALELMAATLRTLGIGVRLAGDGAQALESIEREPPDALILDLAMPGLGGFDLLRILRGRPDLRDLPVFVWTGVDLTSDELAALARSALAVADKSDDGLEALVGQLRAWQARRTRGGAS